MFFSKEIPSKIAESTVNGQPITHAYLTVFCVRVRIKLSCFVLCTSKSFANSHNDTLTYELGSMAAWFLVAQPLARHEICDGGRWTGTGTGTGRTGWHTNWVALAEAWALASSRAQHKHGWLKWAKCQTIKKTPLPTATSTAAPLCAYLLCVTRSCWFLLSWPSQSCNLNHQRGRCGRNKARAGAGTAPESTPVRSCCWCVVPLFW